MGNVVVSPSNKPYSAALEFSESAPVAEESTPLNRTVRSASPALWAFGAPSAPRALCARASVPASNAPSIRIIRRFAMSSPGCTNARPDDIKHVPAIRQDVMRSIFIAFPPSIASLSALLRNGALRMKSMPTGHS